LRVLPGLPWICSGFLAASLFSHTIALRLLLLLCGAAIAAVALRQERGALRPLPPVWLAFALWAVWGLASLAWSIEPERTLKEWRNEVFYTAVAFWICFVGAQAGNAARVIPALVALGITAAIGAALYTFQVSWEAYLVGPHSGPGDHSSALLTLLPCLAMAAWYGSRAAWPRWVLALLALLGVLFAASAYATLNRTLWLGVAVELTVLGGLMLLRAEHTGLTIRRAAVIFGTVFAILFLSFFSVQATREASGIGQTAVRGDHRLLLWPEIVEQIGEKPLTGYGFGRGLLRDPLRQDFGSIDTHLWHAHNIVLEAMVQLGIPGLALLALLLGMLVRAGWRYACSADERLMACGIALIAVVAGMLMRNMTDTLFVRQNALLFWGVAGVLLGLPLSRVGAAARTPAPSAAAARAPRPG
jgi:O-antigen ligase